MKTFLYVISALYFLSALSSVYANEDDLAFCDQRLLQSSISCADAESLELCIMESMENAGCGIEISSEEDVDFCNENCKPDFSLVSE